MNREEYNQPLRPISQLILELKDIELQLYKYCDTREYKPSAQDEKYVMTLHDISFQIRVLAAGLKEIWEYRKFRDS